MKTHTKKPKHQVSDAGIKAVRAGEWEQRIGGAGCKCCNPDRPFRLPPVKITADQVFGKLPNEKLVEASRQAAASAKEFKAALEAARLKKRPAKPKRTYIRGARGRFAMKPETRETAAALADAVQTRKSIMERAIEVRKARNQTYGGPGPEWACQASMLNAYMRRRFGHSPVVIQAHDIGAFNMIQKLSRHASCMATGDYHQDNMVDAAGFADCIDEVLTAQQRPWQQWTDALIKFLKADE